MCRKVLQWIIVYSFPGLDPAGIEYTNVDTKVRLDPSDAVFVDIIHTDDNGWYTITY